MISEVIFPKRHDHESDTGTYSTFGYRMSGRSFGCPKKKRIEVTVPYMNGSYDFSYLPISNDPRFAQSFYDNREISYTFDVPGYDTESIYNKCAELVNWFTEGAPRKFYDTAFPSMYLTGTVTNTEVVDKGMYGQVTVTITAYPFMRSRYSDGHDVWDTINFDLDILQETTITMDRGSGKTFVLYNTGCTNAFPHVWNSSKYVIELRNAGIICRFNPGRHNPGEFALHPGKNSITVQPVDWTEPGSVVFDWEKEMI